jgi:hypothetical protein
MVKAGLIGDNGSLTKIIKATSVATADSAKIIDSYRKGSAIDPANAAKLLPSAEKNALVARYEAEIKALEQQLTIAADDKQKQEIAAKLDETKKKKDDIYTLTPIDLEREKNATQKQININNNLVADYDNQIKILTEQLAKTTDPGNKSALQASIDAYKKNKEALDKNTEGLKASEAAFAKYNTETLPSLIRALTESQDPAKAVRVAGEDFNNIYQKDSTGKATNYIKDIAQLRAESAKYVEAIGSKYAIDNSSQAESEAIAGLKAARDNRITLPSGESGMRETVANRINLTDQIVKIQQVESQRVIAAKTLEAEKLKVLTSSGSLAEQEARIKAADISIEIAQKNLETKEREIQEYAQFPRKVVELEQQAATMRVQIEQQVADKQRAIRDREFALRQTQYRPQYRTPQNRSSGAKGGELRCNLQECPRLRSLKKTTSSKSSMRIAPD